MTDVAEMQGDRSRWGAKAVHLLFAIARRTWDRNGFAWVCYHSIAMNIMVGVRVY